MHLARPDLLPRKPPVEGVDTQAKIEACVKERLMNW
jgi:hypothetical protein